MLRPACVGLLALCLSAAASAQPPRFGPSPDPRPLQAYRGAVGPSAGSAGGRVYLALYEPALAERGVVVEILGRLGEPGLIRLAPHQAAGLAPAEAPLPAEVLIDLWQAAKQDFDADFALAEAHFEASASHPATAAAACPASRLVAFIAEDGSPDRRSQGEQTFCGPDRWWTTLAPRLRALAIERTPGCAGLPRPGPWSDLARCLKP